MANLQELWLDNNRITSIESGDFDGLTNLQKLWLEDNQITSLESGAFDGLANLERLDLGDNQITGIERGAFDGLNNLQWLYLGHSQITGLESGDFEGLANLQTLDLGYNQITSIESGDFDGLANLQTLGLRWNQITSIESGDFNGLTNLRRLDLDGNQITSIENGGFVGLTNLETLYLPLNNISELNLTGATFEHLMRCTSLAGFCVDSDEIARLTLDDAVLSLGSFHVIFRETNSITDTSLVGLTFSDKNPRDLGRLLSIGTLDNVTVDQGLFDAYADEFNSFAEEAGNTVTIVRYGDSNRDGQFNSSDFVHVFVAGKYETGEPAKWVEGDWNGDRLFDSLDSIIAFADGLYEQGLQGNIVAVPEPGAIALLLTAACLLLLRRCAGQRLPVVLLPMLFLATTSTHADIYRWDTGEVISGTEGIEPGPGVQLDQIDLQYAALADWPPTDLTGASFEASNLANARLTRSVLNTAIFTNANLSHASLDRARLIDADLTGAVVTGASFSETTRHGFSKEQLYSTASYQVESLQGISLRENDLTGWDFSGQDLTGADLSFSILTHANLRGALIARGDFDFAETLGCLTKEQLYSTASYQAKDLQGIQISLPRCSLSGLDLSGQDLTNARLSVREADITGAVVTGAGISGVTEEQLYSTASYQMKNLRGIRLFFADLTGWDFSEQDLTGAYFAASPDMAPGPFPANLTNANLTRANLSDARLFQVNLTGAKMAGANLANSELSYANLFDADLASADLTGATLRDVHLSGADLSWAIVTEASLSGSGITKEQLYSTASYQAKNLQGINLANNDLTGWNFAGQDLTNANISYSTLTNADLTRATLKNARLTDSSNLDHALFDSETTYNQWTVFPDDFDPVAEGLTLVESQAGDFDASDALDVNDVDWLGAKVRSNYRVYVPWWLPDAMFDLNSDDTIDLDDHRMWVKDLAHTWYGDANLDGEFNSSDFAQVLTAGKYEKGWLEEDRWPEGQLAVWSEGDWNGDWFFNSSDMVTAFVDGGYEQGPRPAAATVPEPASILQLLLGLAGIFWASLRRR